MLLSKVIEMYKEKLEKHGDHHVIFGEDMNYITSDITFDSELKVFLTEEKEAESKDEEILVNCQDCGTINKSDALEIDDCVYICKSCFEKDGEYRIFSDDIGRFYKDENGFYSKRKMIKRNGCEIYCEKCNHFICTCEESEGK